MRVYVLGLMTGKKLYNFPAFDAARDALQLMGHDVVSPADEDRAVGIDPATLPADHDWSQPYPGMDRDEMIRRSLDALMDCEAVVCLDGWRNGLGASAEKAVAAWRGMPAYMLVFGKLVLLQEETKQTDAKQSRELANREN